MLNKFLISIIAILIGYSSYGQSSNKIILKDSTKIKILGNSIYRVNEKTYKNNNLSVTDSTSIKYTKLFLLNVLFKTSKSEVLSKSFDQLNKLSVLLKDNPKIRIEINGHTDRLGNSKSNLKLSKKRAKKIKKYLIKSGVRSVRIATNGFGDEFPICDSPCTENRRVEFIISEKLI